jgi:hypothetical protein
MNERLKKIVFKKLYNDLSQVEIIRHGDSIWFINRENKYWYFEYEKEGTLWWKYQFFTDFFKLFCLERSQFELVISEWVEEVLNCKVITPETTHRRHQGLVEEVLNCKVITPLKEHYHSVYGMEEVLNCKVITPYPTSWHRNGRVQVEEVLNHKVTTAIAEDMRMDYTVSLVLNQ